METQVIKVFKEESQDMAISDLTLESLTWHDVESKLYKAMASLNAFDLRDKRYVKPRVSFNALTPVKTGVKVIEMFDPAFDRNQMHGKSL